MDKYNRSMNENMNIDDPNAIQTASDTGCKLLLTYPEFNINVNNPNMERRYKCRDLWLERNNLPACPKPRSAMEVPRFGKMRNVNVDNVEIKVVDENGNDNGNIKKCNNTCCYRKDDYISKMKLGVSGKNPDNVNKDCSWSIGVL